MLEIPEIMTLARQMRAELPGRTIRQSICGTTPHKFAWYSRPVEEYPDLLTGHTFGQVTSAGHFLTARVEPGWAFLLGDMGARILLHPPGGACPPEKHQILLHFDDGAALTVTIQMWGCLFLLPVDEIPHRPKYHIGKLAPLSDEFTEERFSQAIEEHVRSEDKSVKSFMISKPGLFGIGNGCLQDILWNARLHPRRQVARLSKEEVSNLYDATLTTLKEMARQRGRSSEKDLYNCPGGYQNILDSRSAGGPCPRCQEAIQKIQYLGGASYFCPRCQV
jgi:formamidopyrimidine-DNA glycosylase